MFSALRKQLTPRSIRAQLTLWYLLMLSAALAAFAAFVFVARTRTLYREADADLEIRASHIATELRPELLGLNVSDELAAKDELRDAAVAVRETSGRIIFKSDAFPDLDWPSERALSRAASGDDSLVSAANRSGAPLLVATVISNRAGAAPLAVQVAEPTDALRHILRQLAAAMALFFVVVLAIASYGGSFIARRALAPVDAIVGRVHAIQANRLEDRLPVHTGSEELDRLVLTLNGMLDRIESSMHSAQRFAADASHELQTPIAAMRTALEVSAAGHPLVDPSTTARELLDDLDRLSTLVRDLRLLALADAGHLVDRVAAVDLSGVARDCCEIAWAIAEPRQIAVEADIADDVIVSGSALHLRRVFLNLLENAIRYSPEGSTVRLQVVPVERDVLLSITDEGCGIGDQDLPHIFERFYRADPARARDTGGSGLGLAIADQIVRSHGGRIDVSSTIDRGSVFTVALPLMRPVPAQRSEPADVS